MADFKPRLVRPEAGNPYYNTRDNGGYSDACKGKPTDAGCNVLSNCVGYAFGRFNEIGGWGSCRYLRPVNAENFIQYAGGLTVGQEPRVGACMVWQKGATLTGSDGAGHVAIVEKVLSGSCVQTSESGWGCQNPFWLQTRYKGSGNWGQGSAYKFLGFIYNPAPCCASGGSTGQETAGEAVRLAGTAKTGVNVRSGPGTGYGIISGLAPGQKVTIVQKSGQWGKLSGGGWCCLTYIDLAESGDEKPGTDAGWVPKVGDIVQFDGGKHYVNAYAVAGTGATAGKARISTIFQLGKSKHPYHLIRVAGGGSNVYGWVDAGTFKKA